MCCGFWDPLGPFSGGKDQKNFSPNSHKRKKNYKLGRGIVAIDFINNIEEKVLMERRLQSTRQLVFVGKTLTGGRRKKKRISHLWQGGP